MKPFENAFTGLESAVNAGAAPCAAAAVGTGGQVLRQQVWGSACLEPFPVPATLRTRFDMASMTKILSTSMVALRFLEAGLLSLDQTLGDFFPQARGREKITIRQLMTHTGGFVPYLNLEQKAASPQEALQVIFDSQPVCVPGTEVHYSCMGYIVLGKILETLGGKPLNLLAEELVFKPLSMNRTGYCPTGEDFAATERLGDQWLQGIVHDENARFLQGVSGNAGVFSDLGDMTRFASMLALGGSLENTRILSPSTLEMAIRCETEGMEQRRGLGFHLASPGSFHGNLASPRCYGHTGFTGTSLIVEPDSGFWAVLLSNRVHPTRENTAFFSVRRDFHHALFREFF